MYLPNPVTLFTLRYAMLFSYKSYNNLVALSLLHYNLEIRELCHNISTLPMPTSYNKTYQVGNKRERNDNKSALK